MWSPPQFDSVERSDAFLNGTTILTFGAEAAERAAMGATGHGIALAGITLADCLMAATAFARGFTLVSNDLDLCRVPGLKVVDWRPVR